MIFLNAGNLISTHFFDSDLYLYIANLKVFLLASDG